MVEAISRAFEMNDLVVVYRFLGEARRAVENCHYLHRGDVCWQLFHMLATYPATELIRLWEDGEGTLIGFAFVYPAFGMFDIQVKAEFRDAEREAEMWSWVEKQMVQLNGAVGGLYSLVNEHDAMRRAMLEAQGFQPMGDWLYMQRSLREEIETPEVVDGFRVSDMMVVEVGSRAEALASAFGAEPQPEQYRAFMQAEGYEPTLDVVMVEAAGQVASFAMCWIDDVSRTGQFEPVGTAPTFQRQGLGRLTLLEGMRRMRERGMGEVIVIVEGAEEAAVHLYTSVGMAQRWKIYLYGRAAE